MLRGPKSILYCSIMSGCCVVSLRNFCLTSKTSVFSRRFHCSVFLNSRSFLYSHDSHSITGTLRFKKLEQRIVKMLCRRNASPISTLARTIDNCWPLLSLRRLSEPIHLKKTNQKKSAKHLYPGVQNAKTASALLGYSILGVGPQPGLPCSNLIRGDTFEKRGSLRIGARWWISREISTWASV